MNPPPFNPQPAVPNNLPQLIEAGTAATCTGSVDACWNERGVYGNKQCARLREFAHCRHCPVYSAAGARLLERPLPTGYRSEWAAYFGEQKGPPEPGNTSAVLFRLGNDWLGLPTQVVVEVADRRPIHSLPGHNHGAILGVAALRGELLICVSLGHLMALGSVPTATSLRLSHTRVVVGIWESCRYVFPVNEVNGPCRFCTKDVVPPPATLSRSDSCYTQSVLRWQDQAVGLLDPGQVFQCLNRALS